MFCSWRDTPQGTLLRVAALTLIASLACAEIPVGKWLADAWAHSQAKETKPLAERIAALMESGDHEQASAAARNAAASERAAGSVKSAVLWERLSKQLHAESEFQQVLRSMRPDIQATMTEFHAAAHPMSLVAPVAVEAQPFVRAFLNSAKTPEPYYGRMSLDQKFSAGPLDDEAPRKAALPRRLRKK